MNVIKRGFANLLNFSGRDRPGQFWPYCGVVFLGYLGFCVIGMSIAMSSIFARAQVVARDHPEDVVVTQGPGHYSMEIKGDHPEIMSDFGIMTFANSVIALVIVLLLAAAVTRRLHDRNWRGYWALIPVALLFSGLVQMVLFFNSFQQDGDPQFDRFFLIFGNNLLYLVSLAILIVSLCLKGQPHPNRFGDPPAP